MTFNWPRVAVVASQTNALVARFHGLVVAVR